MCKGNCTYQGIARRARANIVHDGDISFTLSNSSSNQFWIESRDGEMYVSLYPETFMHIPDNQLKYIGIVNSRNQK